MDEKSLILHNNKHENYFTNVRYNPDAAMESSFSQNDVIFDLARISYMECVVPDIVMQTIKLEVDRMIDTKFAGYQKHNYDLAGAIENEYKITDSLPVIQNFVTSAAINYWTELNSDYKNYEHAIGIGPEGDAGLWVNFQKKYEYNPVHKHGGLLSFVIWYQVPYDIESERSLPMHQNYNDSSAGTFMFIFPDPYSLGGINSHRILVDKSKEGHMIIFPASLRHVVYPFHTSDDYRISIAGNLVCKEYNNG